MDGQPHGIDLELVHGYTRRAAPVTARTAATIVHDPRWYERHQAKEDYDAGQITYEQFQTRLRQAAFA